MGVHRFIAAALVQFDDRGGTDHRVGGALALIGKSIELHREMWPIIAAITDSIGRMGYLVVARSVLVWGGSVVPYRRFAAGSAHRERYAPSTVSDTARFNCAGSRTCSSVLIRHRTVTAWIISASPGQPVPGSARCRWL